MVFSFSLPHQISSLSSLPLFNFFSVTSLPNSFIVFTSLPFPTLSSLSYSASHSLLCVPRSIYARSHSLFSLSFQGFPFSLSSQAALLSLSFQVFLSSHSPHTLPSSPSSKRISLYSSRKICSHFHPQVSLFSLPPKLFSCHSLLATPTPSSWILLAFTPKPFSSYSSRNLYSYFPSKLFSIPYFLSSQAVLSPKPFSFSFSLSPLLHSFTPLVFLRSSSLLFLHALLASLSFKASLSSSLLAHLPNYSFS